MLEVDGLCDDDEEDFEVDDETLDVDVKVGKDRLIEGSEMDGNEIVVKVVEEGVDVTVLTQMFLAGSEFFVQGW